MGEQVARLWSHIHAAAILHPHHGEGAQGEERALGNRASVEERGAPTDHIVAANGNEIAEGAVVPLDRHVAAAPAPQMLQRLIDRLIRITDLSLEPFGDAFLPRAGHNTIEAALQFIRIRHGISGAARIGQARPEDEGKDRADQQQRGLAGDDRRSRSDPDEHQRKRAPYDPERDLCRPTDPKLS